jgi:hypothetical protein
MFVPGKTRAAEQRRFRISLHPMGQILKRRQQSFVARYQSLGWEFPGLKFLGTCRTIALPKINLPINLPINLRGEMLSESFDWPATAPK